MRVFLILMMLSLAWITPVQAQENSYACTGVGCCCNAQQGGDWPDCAEGYECRRQTTPPNLQICVKKGASPITILQLGSNQPAECKRPPTPEESAAKSCHGSGCCCNAQAGGNFPDCDKGFECRRQTTPPNLQLCVKKGSPPQTPLQLASKEPAECKMAPSPEEVASKKCHRRGCCCNVQGGFKWPDCDPGFECRRQAHPPNLQLCMEKAAPANALLELDSTQPANCAKGATPFKAPAGLPGKGHPVCEQQPSPESRQWCYKNFNPPPDGVYRK